MGEDKELERIKARMIERLMRSREESLLVSGSVVELDSSNFEEALRNSSLPLLVDFWASWCAPCTVMKPVVEQLARDYAGRVSFAKVDVDRNQDLARRFGIMGIPSFIVFRNGRPVDRVVGAVGRAGLEAVLRRHLG
ncbi:MAG: thioredoxin [Candidatus Bathyarchaeia archaeon]